MAYRETTACFFNSNDITSVLSIHVILIGCVGPRCVPYYLLLKDVINLASIIIPVHYRK